MSNKVPIQKDITAKRVHIDRALTSISIAFMNDNDVWLAPKIFPIVPVSKKSDKYFVYDKGDMLRIAAKIRAAGTESEGAGYDLDTDNYSCDTYALHTMVTDEEVDNADTPLQPMSDATEFVSENLLMLREKLVLDKIFVANTWGGGSGNDVSPTTAWDLADSYPIIDVSGWARDLGKRIGKSKKMIKMVVTPDVDEVLRNHSTIIERVKYTSTKSVDAELLKSLFGIGGYMVAEAVEAPNAKGSANENDTEYIAGTNKIWLGFVQPSPSKKKPSAGYTFTWKGGQRSVAPRIKKMYMETRESTRVEGQMNIAPKMVVSEAGTYGTVLS